MLYINLYIIYMLYTNLYILFLKTVKNCVLFNSVQERLLAASDFLDMFVQPIKFYYTFHYHVLREKKKKMLFIK